MYEYIGEVESVDDVDVDDDDGDGDGSVNLPQAWNFGAYGQSKKTNEKEIERREYLEVYVKH